MSTIATTIAQQIGRTAFALLGTGNNRWSDNDALIFGVKGSRCCNRIKVTLEPTDTYRVDFYKIGRAPGFRIDTTTVEGIHVDQLHETIERHTDLVLSF